MTILKQVIIISLLCVNLYSQTTTKRLGDILQLAIPATAYGATLILDDKVGQEEFYKSYATTIGTTYTLKYMFPDKRPQSTNMDSFPSGHTSSAFSGASFIYERYGLSYAILPFIGATYTAYSRVHERQHEWDEVIAGAAIGILSSKYFVTPYKNLDIQPIIEKDYKGIQLSYKW